MKKLLFYIALLSTLNINAQNYLITFTGTGESSLITSVKVENQRTGNALTLNGSDILRLNITTGINSIEAKELPGLKIYPNPSDGNTLVQIYPPVEGIAIVSISDLEGKKLAHIQDNLESTLQEFQISGLDKGIYLVTIKGMTYQFSGKILCNSNTKGTITIKKCFNNQITKQKKITRAAVANPVYVDMEYIEGDRLRFTAISDIYSSIKTDTPSSDKTITFNFIACIDGDNFSYPVVEIGTQIWMAENLKTSKFSDGSTIPLITDWTWGTKTTPGYCYYLNDGATYKDIFGALYNWYAIDEVSNGGKDICPAGWHVPTDNEWSTLTDYLINNGFGYQGSGDDIAKCMASTTGWRESSILGTPGNDQVSNNSSRFKARPGGGRGYDGTFSAGGIFGWWWTSTEANSTISYDRGMYPDKSRVERWASDKKNGFSVRCLKNN